MDELALVFDPGGASGWSTWIIPEAAPIRRVDYGVILGGADGFDERLPVMLRTIRPDLVICEKFILDGRTAIPDITPKECEGVLRAHLSIMGEPAAILQPAADKALSGKEPERRDQRITDHGLWVKGFDQARSQGRTGYRQPNGRVDWTDARDVNDTTLHIFAWARHNDHMPTIELLWPDN